MAVTTTPSTAEFLAATPFDELVGPAAELLAIDRPYLVVPFDGGTATVPELAARVASLRDVPPGRWSAAETELVCALHALGVAYIRFEQVGITLDMERIDERLRALHARYVDHLGPGEGAPPAGSDVPWWQVAAEVAAMRGAVDRSWLRVLEIDGATWHRDEWLLPLDAIDVDAVPPQVDDALVALGLRRRAGGTAFEAHLQREAPAAFDRGVDPVELITLLMRLATQDPRHPADHATLMGLTGTNLTEPGRLTRHDFFIWTEFAPGYDPTAFAGVGDARTVRKAMHAHHSVKKQRVSRKSYAEDGTYRAKGLADDLGARGIFHDESTHHRGHLIAGVNAAMRSVMSVEVDVPGAGRRTIQGLTDWRLSRSSAAVADRFGLEHYPSFFAYGHWIRAVVEVALSRGVVLPARLGEW